MKKVTKTFRKEFNDEIKKLEHIVKECQSQKQTTIFNNKFDDMVVECRMTLTQIDYLVKLADKKKRKKNLLEYMTKEIVAFLKRSFRI